MRYLPYMIHNVTVDICGHLCGNTMSLFFKIYEKPIKQYLHPSCCPFSVSIYQRSNWLIDFKTLMIYYYNSGFLIRKGHVYVQNFTISMVDYPPIVPAGNAYSRYIFYTVIDNVDHILFEHIAHFEIVTKGIDRFWYGELERMFCFCILRGLNLFTCTWICLTYRDSK